MDATTSPRKPPQAARITLLVLGSGVIAYAASDHPFYGGPPGFGAAGAGMLALGLAIAAAALLPPLWRRRVLLMTLSLGFTLGVAEVALDLVLSPRYRAPYEYSERYLFRLRPSSWSSWSNPAVGGGEPVLHRINDAGFRGEPLLPKGQATRVVVYGDSFIHAFYTPLPETFTEQLEDRLEEGTGKPVEVVNAGTSSYGPDQNLLRLEKELDTLAPDHVVFAVFAGNDYGDLLRNKFFEVDDAGRLKPRPYSLEPFLRAKFDLSHQESIIRIALRKATQSRPARAAPAGVDPGIAMVDEWLAVAAAEYEDYVDGDDVVTNPNVDRCNVDNAVLPNSEAARYKVRLMESVLTRAARLARSKSTPFTLLVIPHPMDVVDGGEFGRVDRARFPDYRRTNLTGALTEMAARAGIDAIDLFPPFRERRGEGLFIGHGDDHWNAAGQRLAAELTAAHLLQQGTLKPSR